MAQTRVTILREDIRASMLLLLKLGIKRGYVYAKRDGKAYWLMTSKVVDYNGHDVFRFSHRETCTKEEAEARLQECANELNDLINEQFGLSGTVAA